MTRKEYELVFQAFKNYRLYMTDEQEVLSEKILDDLFYPEFDKLSTDDLVAYVTDDMSDYVNKLSPVEFFEEGYNYWEDDFDEIVEDFKGGQSENDLN